MQGDSEDYMSKTPEQIGAVDYAGINEVAEDED